MFSFLLLRPYEYVVNQLYLSYVTHIFVPLVRSECYNVIVTSLEYALVCTLFEYFACYLDVTNT